MIPSINVFAILTKHRRNAILYVLVFGRRWARMLQKMSVLQHITYTLRRKKMKAKSSEPIYNIKGGK